jgi:hypothetical protein
MSLTIEQQRKLTEKGLGECWHECDEDRICRKCHQFLGTNEEMRLNFTDWRVVGRLIEKLEAVYVDKMGAGPYFSEAFILGGKNYISVNGTTPQEAICLVVLAWIEEGEKG